MTEEDFKNKYLSNSERKDQSLLAVRQLNQNYRNEVAMNAGTIKQAALEIAST